MYVSPSPEPTYSTLSSLLSTGFDCTFPMKCARGRGCAYRMEYQPTRHTHTDATTTIATGSAWARTRAVDRCKVIIITLHTNFKRGEEKREKENVKCTFGLVFPCFCSYLFTSIAKNRAHSRYLANSTYA